MVMSHELRKKFAEFFFLLPKHHLLETVREFGLRRGEERMLAAVAAGMLSRATNQLLPCLPEQTRASMVRMRMRPEPIAIV